MNKVVYLIGESRNDALANDYVFSDYAEAEAALRGDEDNIYSAPIFIDPGQVVEEVEDL